MVYTADREICRDAEGNIVDCDRPEGAFVVVVKGGTLSDAEARRYGLLDAPAEEKASESKAIDGPAEDKAVKGSANKSAKGDG